MSREFTIQSPTGARVLHVRTTPAAGLP